MYGDSCILYSLSELHIINLITTLYPNAEDIETTKPDDKGRLMLSTYHSYQTRFLEQGW